MAENVGSFAKTVNFPPFSLPAQLFPSKPHGIDVFSDKAVKIEATSLDQIFDSDEEEEEVSQGLIEMGCTNNVLAFFCHS